MTRFDDALWASRERQRWDGVSRLHRLGETVLALLLVAAVTAIPIGIAVAIGLLLR